MKKIPKETEMHELIKKSPSFTEKEKKEVDELIKEAFVQIKKHNEGKADQEAIKKTFLALREARLKLKVERSRKKQR